jgi:hypothetical protein
MAADDEVTNGEIVRRLESLHQDVRGMNGAFVRVDLYDSQRQDSGRRVGNVERELAKLRADREADKLENDRRYRNVVNIGIAALLSFLGGVGLFLLQLVAK